MVIFNTLKLTGLFDTFKNWLVKQATFVRNEGEVIRHNMGWTLIMLGWLILVGLLYYFLFPGVMR